MQQHLGLLHQKLESNGWKNIQSHIDHETCAKIVQGHVISVNEITKRAKKHFLGQKNGYCLIALIGSEDHSLRLWDHSGSITAIFTNSLSISHLCGILLIETFNVVAYRSGTSLCYALEIQSDYVHPICVIPRVSRLIQSITNKVSELSRNIADTRHQSESNVALYQIKGICLSHSPIFNSFDANSDLLFFVEFVDCDVYDNSGTLKTEDIVKVKFNGKNARFWKYCLSVGHKYILSNITRIPSNSLETSNAVFSFRSGISKKNKAQIPINFYNLIPSEVSSEMSWIIECNEAPQSTNTLSVQTQADDIDGDVLSVSGLNINANNVPPERPERTKKKKRNPYLLFSQASLVERPVYPAPSLTQIRGKRISIQSLARINDKKHTQSSESVYHFPNMYDSVLQESQFASLLCSQMVSQEITKNNDHSGDNPNCINYEGIITKVHTQSVWILDDSLKVYLCKCPLDSGINPVGFRIGAQIRLYHAHLIMRDTICVGLACCGHTVVELVKISDRPMDQKWDPVKHKLRELDSKGNNRLFYDKQPVLSQYYERESIHRCIDIVAFVRFMKWKFKDMIPTRAILGTRRGLNSDINSNDPSIVQYFCGPSAERKSMNEDKQQSQFLQHDQCSFFSNEPLTFPKLTALHDQILGYDQIKKGIKSISQRRGPCHPMFVSLQNTMGILSISKKGYFILQDATLKVVTHIIPPDDGNEAEFKLFADLVQSLSSGHHFLVMINQSQICLIRQRAQLISVSSPPKKRNFRYKGDAACILMFHCADCNVIKVLSSTLCSGIDKVSGRKRSFSTMMEPDKANDLVHSTPMIVDFVSLLERDGNDSSFVVRARKQSKASSVRFRLEGESIALYPCFYAGTQCEMMMADRASIRKNTMMNVNTGELHVCNPKIIKSARPISQQPAPDSFNGWIWKKQWILDHNGMSLDRLLVIHHDINRIVAVDIPHSVHSTFFMPGMLVSFSGFGIQDRSRDQMIAYCSWRTRSNDSSSSSQNPVSGMMRIKFIVDLKEELKSLSLQILPFANLYELPFDDLYYGKLERFIDCRIIEIISMRITLQCYQCSGVMKSKSKFCKKCGTKGIVGLGGILDIVIDDGSAQCALVWDFSDHDIRCLLDVPGEKEKDQDHLQRERQRVCSELKIKIKETGTMTLDLRSAVQISENVNSSVIWHNLSRRGIAIGARCKGFGYIQSHLYERPGMKVSTLRVDGKDNEDLNEWMSRLGIRKHTISNGYGRRFNSVRVLKQSLLVLNCISIETLESVDVDVLDGLLRHLDE